MKHAFALAIVLFALASLTYGQSAPQVEVYFSPKGGCTDAIIREIKAARISILVQAYTLSHLPIARALVDAHERGVAVYMILDAINKRAEGDWDWAPVPALYFHRMELPTRIDNEHVAHNNVMVIDGQVVITGSFHFVQTAEETNAENLLVIRGRETAAKYTANWQKHAEHSDPVGGGPRKPVPAIPTEPTKFAGSRKSPIFHRAWCALVSKYPSKDVIQYASRAEAIQARKEPCCECKP